MTLASSLTPSVGAGQSRAVASFTQYQNLGQASFPRSLPDLAGIAPSSQSTAALQNAIGGQGSRTAPGQSAAVAQHVLGSTANVWASHIANKNEGEAAMTVPNQFWSPDDVFRYNPLAKAVLSIPDETVEERARLGKYIPELYSRQDGKISEIRSRMSYTDFIAMYMRMIMDMLKEAPEQVPERLVFLHNIARKAAKFRWSDMRQCYAIAMKDIKHGRRGWGG